jgi:trk system potassium uptake protein TrkH
VTARTAGFNTLPTGALAPVTMWLLMLLMLVGGSPGSTAGGIKTTTASTAVATLWATLTGRPQVEAFRRTIPDEQVAKALALVGVSLAVIALGVMALLATQAGEPLALTFEAVSAFGTVGLSTGLTPRLDAWGKIVLMLLMFVGRTGPLTLGFALAARERRAPVVYPPEKIMIG